MLRRRTRDRDAPLITPVVKADRELARRVTAEAVGTGLLVAAVVGSGIAAQRLSPADVGLQLLENSAATGAALVALILASGPVSGAHFNPVVTLADRAFGGVPTGDALAYMAAQVAGGCAGPVVANLMFDVDAVAVSTTERWSGGLWLGEVVATFGLLVVILGVTRSGRARALRSGRLHRRCLLVHVVDRLRQPGGDRRPHAERHLRRHLARLGADVRDRPARGRVRRHRPRPLPSPQPAPPA